MTHYKYLIIGGGMTADSAVSGIRERDSKGSIALISSEADAPYDRPPLTKGLWKDKPLDSIWRKTAQQNVDLHLGRTVEAIDPGGRSVTDTGGNVYTYDKLLLVTGGSPRQLPFGGEQILYFRTVADYRRLREMCARGERFAVIGGGFIGSELAAALAMNKKKVVMLFPGNGICQHMFPPDLSQFVTQYYREKGVEVLSGESVVEVLPKGNRFSLRTKNQRELEVDAVVAGIGISPNIQLAKKAGLQTNDGIIVNEQLQTNRPDIYAAGDAAEFYNPALDRRLRVEHEDNANTMGRMAGKNMAGAGESYDHLPFFYSDLFDLGYEAVGELDSRLATVAEWKDPFREGVVYYQREGQVRGVLLWNVWGQVDNARELIAQRRAFTRDDLKHALPKAA